MSKKEVIKKIEETILKYGFEVRKENNFGGMPHLKKVEYVDFTIIPAPDFEKSNIKEKISAYKMLIQAGICQMKSNITSEEMLKASDEIKRGAELLKELKDLNLEYTEKF